MNSNHTITVNYPGDRAVVTFFERCGSVENVLEKVFAGFNHGSCSECQDFLNARIRSLSVNDFVRVDDRWYQRKSIGWEKVTDDYVDVIEKLVVEHPQFAEHGPWWCLNDLSYRGIVDRMSAVNQ